MKIFVLFLIIALAFGDPASRLIKAGNSPAVYLILDGKKSWIPNPTTYNRLIVTS
jgi:hypothetical protein